MALPPPLSPAERKLRDLFATEALGALVSIPGTVVQPAKTAALAYAYATAMIIVRRAL